LNFTIRNLTQVILKIAGGIQRMFPSDEITAFDL